jgi:Rrf2 family protein
MFNRTSEYALRVIVFLAAVKGKPATTREIAAVTRVPVGYLAKIVQGLARAGLIKSQRGLHGGSVLARDPADIGVYEVIESVSPLPRIRTCPLELPAHGTNLCPLHRRLDDAMGMVERALRESSIAELVTDPATSVPLGGIAQNRAAAERAAEEVFRVGRPVQVRIGTKGKGQRGRR